MTDEKEKRKKKKINSLMRHYHPKTSPKQWRYIGCFVAFSAVTLTGTAVFPDSLFVTIASFFLILAALCLLCFLIVRENVRICRDARETLEYVSEDVERFDLWVKNATEMDCTNADDEICANKLAAVLLQAAASGECERFYENIGDVEFSRAISLLGKLELSDDFHQFVQDVLAKRLVTPSVFRFEPELYALIAQKAGLDYGSVRFYFSDDVLYHPTKHVRYRVFVNEVTSKYQVEVATWFANDDFLSCWIPDVPNSHYEDFAAAQAEQKRLYEIDEKNFDYEKFFEKTEYSPSGETPDGKSE